jgi:hypothetical protein
VVRLVERTLSWDGYVRLAFDEIRLAGAATDIAAALMPDAEGIGSGADVTTAVRLARDPPDTGVRPGARIPG